MRNVFRWILLGLILLTVALISALTAMRVAIHGREVRIPTLVGLSPAEAERIATENGLLVLVESRFYSADVPAGRIMSQVPAPGTKVRRGWRVRLAQSLGPQRIRIPNVVGQGVRIAEVNLRRQGLEVGSVAVMHLTGTSADEVLAQNPPPDAVEIAGPKVDLLVSAGEPPTLFVMPNFVGLPLSDAVRVLERAGMQVHRTQPRTAQSVAPAAQPPASVETQPPPPEVGQISVPHIARVVAQKPTAGEKIQPGSVVELKAE